MSAEAAFLTVDGEEAIGRTKVERAEREREVVDEDVDWGQNA